MRATLKLELVSAHPELTGDVKVEREQEAQIVGALPPGDATDLWWVGFVSATPNFVGADGEAAYDYVSFSAALSDQADSVNFPISFGLTLRGLQPPATVRLTFGMHCISQVGDAVEAATMIEELDVDWHTESIAG